MVLWQLLLEVGVETDSVDCHRRKQRQKPEGAEDERAIAEEPGFEPGREFL
jgi:hypothetical protein